MKKIWIKLPFAGLVLFSACRKQPAEPALGQDPPREELHSFGAPPITPEPTTTEPVLDAEPQPTTPDP